MTNAGYETIFEIGLKSFPWIRLLHPVPFILAALGLYRFSTKQFYKVVGITIALLGALIFLVAILALVPSSVGQWRAYLNGESSEIEGTIQDFHRAPDLGPANESFTVRGVSFSYNILDSTPCFHNAPLHTGPLHQGLYVKIYYKGGCIQRVDVRHGDESPTARVTLRSLP